MRTATQSLVLCGALLSGCARNSAAAVAAPPGGSPGAPTNAVYVVNRKVSDFPAEEDLSTPEAAYATLNRLSASGEQAFWRRLSVPQLAARMPESSGRRQVSARAASEWLNAEILEVHLWTASNAVVLAQAGRVLDLRWLGLVDGVWLNEGNDVVPTLDAARGRVRDRRARRDAQRLRDSRPPVADPDAHLRPFVEFLTRDAAEPLEFLLRVLATHRVVILGEVHNRPRYWAFNAALARAPVFAESVGVIYLELPRNDQPLMDRFLASDSGDPAPVVEVLRDLFELGWPDQPTVEFCQAIWAVNQALPKERRIRIVLVDMARPWKEIQKREDWRRYDVDRNAFMAGEIERDLREHADDRRHALFIVGYLHAVKGVKYPGGAPFQSAGWHLGQKLGETNVFAVFPHSPVLANSGGVDGRLALGLFETAFARLSNRPMAFPLDHGPFGEQLFDASLDLITSDPYRAAFDAFLYLGPLESEIVSPLVHGFYTDEYAREVDRRCRLMNGRGLAADPEIGEVSGEALRRLRERWWGQPRREWQKLGPLDAWHFGSAWKDQARAAKHRAAFEQTEEIRQEAARLFEAIRKADYTRPQAWRTFPSPDVEYWVHSDAPGWTRWVCEHFRTNPIVRVELGEVTVPADGRPAVPYKLELADRSALEGLLPFEWRPESGRWEGLEGLDWHRGALEPASKGVEPRASSGVQEK